MIVKTYCKNHQVSQQDVIEALTTQYQGIWTPTTRINDDVVNFLNQTFGNSDSPKALPQSKEVLQLAASEQSKLETSQPTDLESENLIRSTGIQTTKILSANLDIQKQTIQHLLDNSNAEILDMINQSGQRLNQQLMDNLQADFEALKSVKPYQPKPVDTSAYDSLMAELEEAGITTSKS